MERARINTWRGGTLRRFLDNDMGIDSTESKGTDSRQPQFIACPCGQLGRHLKRQVLPRNVGIWLVEVQVRWNLPMAQRQDHLHEARHPRRRFKMPDIRLHRAYEQRMGSSMPQHVTQGAQFNRITQHGASSVRFNITKRMARDLRGGEGLPQQCLLG